VGTGVLPHPSGRCFLSKHLYTVLTRGVPVLATAIVPG